MTWFEDLTPYRYGRGIDALNVGWLGEGKDFPTGKVPRRFLRRLRRYRWVRCRQAFGMHDCELCPPPPIDPPSYGVLLSRADDGSVSAKSTAVTSAGTKAEAPVPGACDTGEICVFDRRGRLYVAPRMIVHYITVHDYMPPTEFVDAVLKGPAPPHIDYFAQLEQRGIQYARYYKGRDWRLAWNRTLWRLTGRNREVWESFETPVQTAPRPRVLHRGRKIR